MSVPQEDMVQTIADGLKPWADPYQQRDVIAGIGEQIKRLEAAFPELSREGVRATRESARRVLDIVANLQHALGAASPEMRMRLSPYRGTLEAIQRECAAAVEGTLTEGRRNLVKEWCARSAWALVCRFSKSPPTSGSSDSPYRHITGLLYKIINPEAGDDEIPDFERICEAVLKACALGQNAAKKVPDL
jgi:hypothetical protein